MGGAVAVRRNAPSRPAQGIVGVGRRAQGMVESPHAPGMVEESAGFPSSAAGRPSRRAHLLPMAGLGGGGYALVVAPAGESALCLRPEFLRSAAGVVGLQTAPLLLRTGQVLPRPANVPVYLRGMHRGGSSRIPIVLLRSSGALARPSRQGVWPGLLRSILVKPRRGVVLL